MIQGKAFGENTDIFLAMEKHKDAEVVGLSTCRSNTRSSPGLFPFDAQAVTAAPCFLPDRNVSPKRQNASFSA